MKKIFEIAVVPFITIIISVVLGLIFKDNFIVTFDKKRQSVLSFL